MRLLRAAELKIAQCLTNRRQYYGLKYAVYNPKMINYLRNLSNTCKIIVISLPLYRWHTV